MVPLFAMVLSEIAMRTRVSPLFGDWSEALGGVARQLAVADVDVDGARPVVAVDADADEVVGTWSASG